MTKTYTRSNFHKHTFCIWQEVPFADVKDMKISYTSDSGSRYIFTAEGLYRISDHWGRVANCHWRLVPMAEFKNQHVTVAFAYWKDFYSNDDASRLFFIKMNWETQEVNFYHKFSAEPEEKAVLRNAKETAKTIRTIKEVLSETNWAKYLEYEDLEVLRKRIVNELIHTDQSFLEIKKGYLV